MIYTIREYALKFKFRGKFVSRSTITRRCENGQLPKDHIPKKLKGIRAPWVIEVLTKKEDNA